ncbi:MAG: DUF1643 domain-containing protein [Acutalibacteraceae bacterium]
MTDKITKHSPTYPNGYEPDYIIPTEYGPHRFLLGKRGENPLVAICMNPSAAKDTSSDLTVNRIITISQKLRKDGWIVFNLYPERATDANKMDPFKQELSDRNVKEIKKFLVENNIKEVWGAWGDDKKLNQLIKGKQQLLTMIADIGVKVFYFGTLTRKGNPRHPLQRYEKWDLSKKEYLNLQYFTIN